LHPDSLVAIDGPAGAGKSTLARGLSAHFHYRYIDTGAMYRAVTLACLRRDIDPDDATAIAAMLRNLDLQVTPGTGGNPSQVFLDGEDVTPHLRGPAVNQAVSIVSRHQVVRSFLVARQRALAEGGCMVMDGRDIGTKVLPWAKVKIYVTCSLEERAARRQADLARSGLSTGHEHVARELHRRDILDQGREIDPLLQAEDAYVIDTTGREAADVLAEAIAVCLARGIVAGTGGKEN